MSYIEIDLGLVEMDLILTSWAKARGLSVNNEFTQKDERFIQVLDDAGDSYGLWVAPQEDGSVSIVIAENAVNGSRVPDYQARTQQFTVQPAELGKTLNSAYALAGTWMHERGHARTPAL